MYVCEYVCAKYKSLWFHKFNLQKQVDVLLDYRRHISTTRDKNLQYLDVCIDISNDGDMYVASYD